MKSQNRPEYRFVGKIATFFSHCPDLLLCLGLCCWGLYIRVMAAGKVFPAVGDVSHFVQYGKVYAATGALESLSSLWSLAPQLLSAWSMRLGLMPQFVLQMTTVVFGVLAIAGVYALAMELTHSRRVAVVAGLIVATNPIMTDLAATGFSDTPHFALGTLMLALAFAGARRRKAWLFALSAALASLDLYYRTYDLFLYLVAAAPFILWRMRGCNWRQGVNLLGTALFVGLVCSMPFFIVTSAISGWNPGHSKLSNLAIGEAGTNAKALYAQSGIDGDKTALSMRLMELEQNGVVKYLWAHKGEILCRYPSNIANGLRVLNGHVFAGMFRMGLFWFLLFCILCARSMRDKMGWYMLVSIGIVLGSISLGFVNPRWIIQCVPFCAVLLGAGFNWLLSHFSSRRTHWVAWGVLLVMGLLNGRWAVTRLDDDWKQRNLFPVCERLHQVMEEDERLMCFCPELPALFYRTNALCWDNIPYDTVEGVFALADVHNVDCLVLDDSTFPHFPIHEIERYPEMVPPQWGEIDRLEFEHETRFELEKNVYRFYRRRNSSTKDMRN